jgi:hypothetical protein
LLERFIPFGVGGWSGVWGIHCKYNNNYIKI